MGRRREQAEGSREASGWGRPEWHGEGGGE